MFLPLMKENPLPKVSIGYLANLLHRDLLMVIIILIALVGEPKFS